VLVHAGLLLLRAAVSRDATECAINIFSFLGYLLPAGFLAALWAPDFAFVSSKLFMQVLDPSGPAEMESMALRPAYRAAQQGSLRLALSLLKPRLRADPWNYEALVLKARLQRHLNRRWRARWTPAMA